MSKNIKIPRNELVAFSRKSLEDYGLSPKTIGSHLYCIKSVANYMEINNIEFFDLDFSKLFIQKITKEDLTHDHRKSRPYRYALGLIERALQGLPYTMHRRERKCYQFPDNEIGKLSMEFIDYVRTRQLGDSTFIRYMRIISDFANKMTSNGMFSFSKITRDIILHYVMTHSESNNWPRIIIKKFLSFLVERNIITMELAHVLDGIRSKGIKTLPSCYTVEEVRKIEDSIDRGTLSGKRNYAMILLASRLGLRSSDICRLKFENIDWENSLIKLVQHKTGKSIELPLLANVGNAIIDYLKNARPKTKSNIIFLTMFAPFRNLTASSFGGVVSRIIVNAGIESMGRHVGPHSLRHSLATAMMKTSSIQTISETLGHSSIKSTMDYLSINVDELMECTHDVPPVDETYYTQKGGAFYV